jgi:RNA-directed DNA polymerase
MRPTTAPSHASAGRSRRPDAVEGSGPAKGNSPDGSAGPNRRMASSGYVRQPEGRRQRFTALMHHVYDFNRLRAAYFALKRDAAAGIDGETWRHYGEVLEANLRGNSASRS